MAVCIFCFNRPPLTLPKGECLYGFRHEYAEEEKPKPALKPDLNKCVRCGLHHKNPQSQTNGCEHMYPV